MYGRLLTALFYCIVSAVPKQYNETIAGAANVWHWLTEFAPALCVWIWYMKMPRKATLSL